LRRFAAGCGPVSRVFELAAPDAPGLVSFGAQFDPGIADSMHAGGPAFGVSPRDAFQGCIGEGIEYLSQLQHRDDLLQPLESSIPALAAQELLGQLRQGISARRS
jgi:hypothetical protein